MIPVPARFSLTLAALAAMAGGLRGQGASMYFDGPEVLKLDWDSRCPRAADFNGDGLTDLAIVSVGRARIEFLLQRAGGAKEAAPEVSSRTDRWNPVLEVSRFDKRPLVIGQGAFTLAVGDWNGDKRPDIAYTTDEEKLVLRTQGKESGDWSQTKQFTLDSVSEDTETLVCSDLNGDGRDDLCLLTKTQLTILLQKAPGEWSPPQSYAMAEAGSAGLRVADLNGDRRPDLFYTAPNGRAILVRLQQDGAGFGEEWRVEIPSSQCWVHPIRLGPGDTGVTWLQEKTGMIEVARLSMGEAIENSDLASTIRHSMPPTDSKVGASTIGDLTGDGVEDVVMADPKNARVWLFSGRADGTFAEGKSYPSLAGIESMAIADLDGDKAADLVVGSPSEKSIAMAGWAKGRLSYPQPLYQLPGTEQIVALTTGNWAGDKSPSILAIVEARSKTALLNVSWSAKDKKWQNSSTEIPSAPSKVIAIRRVDADGDGRGDIALFSSFSSMQILLSRADPKSPFLKVEGLPDSLVSKLPPSGLSQVDIDGDGKQEMVACRDHFARVFTVAADGKARILDQINAPDSAAKIAAVIMSPAKGKEPRVMLMLDSGLHKIHEMQTDAEGIYRVKHSHALPDLSVDDFRVITSTAGRRLLLLGKSSFEMTPLGGAALRLQNVASFDSELKDTKPQDLLPAAFGGGSMDDILTLDTVTSHVLEFFQARDGKPQDWRSTMYFRVFEVDPQYRGKAGFGNEPHDYAAMDLNGDGRLDLCLLTHDRVLIYLRRDG
ncbi:MAG: VCBS repeat-containing protein [Verrucomicrobiales bacterium]|nr:VCBS repeat-containing protein [Verrucomicrobiales bacterium]MCP5557769.1 VCBS repeat-containing protein [Verrucomicrobiaceae bacterium]